MALQKKIQTIRSLYKRRHQKLEKKFRAQIKKNKQKAFLDKFNPQQYHRNMNKLGEAHKRNDLKKILDIVEQYDFFFKNIIFNEMIEDQQKQKNQNVRTIIQLEFKLLEVKQAHTEFGDYENQL